MKYTKKPIEVDAWKVFDIGFMNAPDWVFDAFESGMVHENKTLPSRGDYIVKTLEGDMHFHNGDYLIKGVRGELYAVKSDIFEETYTPVYGTFSTMQEEDNEP